MHFLFVLLVHTCHECLKSCCIFIADGWFIVNVVIILKYLWEYIGNRLSLRVTHHMYSGIYRLSQQLIGQKIALAVAANDAPCLPEADVIQELVTWYSYLANE